MNLTFLGATGTVTGSKYLVESGRGRLLVDCGLFQGVKSLRKRNWQKPPFEPSSLDAVVLTHAHLDHSGYVPLLVKHGFRGPVHGTPGTRALCDILLPDSGHLQEEEARYANRKGFSKHSPALPLYTEEEARTSLKRFRTHDFGETFSPVKGLTCRFTRAGHILGSASVVLDDGTTTLGFSGDVGRPGNTVLRPPAPLERLDYLVVESTYGDRLHPTEDPHTVLAEVLRSTWERGGVVLIPSFAVGRAQEVLRLVAELRAAGEIPPHPVFMDSPMAIHSTETYCSAQSELRLSPEETRAMCGVATFLRTAEESMTLNQLKGPHLIVSASGMATGGRVLHHLKRLLPNPANSVLFVGFQAAGTRGDALTRGAEEVKIHGGYVKVRADVRNLHALSAHADHRELLEWLKRTPAAPRRTFVTHGEASASDAFRRRLRDGLGWDAEVPEDGQRVSLT